jgi:hypothetical protein
MRRMARAALRASSSNGKRRAAGNADPSGTQRASLAAASRPNAPSLIATGVASVRAGAAKGAPRRDRRASRT